ncbi:ABC transporter permease [Alicyclobacillus cycloheptanicus]|nr:ABC transporter permease [Alicyclobacillus cycloheptanicus]
MRTRRPRQGILRRGETWITVIAVVVVLAAWQTIASARLVSAVFLPSPAEVWHSFLVLLASGYQGHTLLQHLGISLARMGVAYVLAVLTAIPLGLASGYSAKFRAAIDPFVEFYRPLPPLAYYTLLIIWLGIGNVSKVALLYLAAFAPIYIACMSGVKSVGEQRIHSALTLGASRWQVFRYVVFPSCLPDIFTGMRTAIGFTYTTLVAAEMVAAQSGIGWMVLTAANFLRSDIVFVGIIIMGITGLLIDGIFRLVERSVVPWKGKE